VRENNEDNVFLMADEHLVLAIVADGMGGAVAGEEASRIAVETIHQDLLVHENGRSSYTEMSADVLSDMLRDVIRTANINIVEYAQQSPEFKGMGTTVTLAMVRNSYAVIGHVGDSRAYLIGQDGDISQITSDHSFVEAMVAAGHISRDEAEDHPMKNVLYRALGQADDIDVDVYHSYLRIGDRLVLCSDGLTLHVKPHEIARIALANDDPEDISQKLIALTNERGGKDNVSVVVINVEPDGSEPEYNVERHMGEEDETLILLDRNSRPFVSSESETSPRFELNDTNYSSTIRSTGTMRTVNTRRRQPLAHRLHREGQERMGEGKDSINPDAW
jgi:PPM family protein phosphatase